MKKTIIVISLAAGFMLGGLLAARPAHAISSPYLLLKDDGETIAAPIITLAKPKLIQPVVAPSNIPFVPLTTSTSSTGTDLSILKSPSDCIDLDTVISGRAAYPDPYWFNDPSNTPTTITLCNKVYDRSGVVSTYGSFIDIFSNNVTIDCNGASLIGNFDFNNPTDLATYATKIGILGAPPGADNLTIKNCTLGGFGYGMFVGGGFNGTNFRPQQQVTIFNNTFTQSSYIDMVVSSAVNSDIYNNTRAAGTDNRSVLPTIDLENVAYSSVHNNTLYSNGGINIAFNSFRVSAYNNKLGKFTSSAKRPSAVDINHGASQNYIYNNTITDADGEAFRLDGDREDDTLKNTGGATLSLIHDNTIDNVQVGAYFTDGAVVNSVYNNVFTNVTGTAFIFDSMMIGGLTVNSHENGTTYNRVSGTMRSIEVKYLSYANAIFGNTFLGFTLPPSDNGSLTSYNNYRSPEGIGNYWNTFDEPAEGCNDLDNNGICDSWYIIPGSNYQAHDFNPVYGYLSINPIDPITVNENDVVSVSIVANAPNGVPLTYSISDPRFQLAGECRPSVNTFEWGTNQDSAGTYTFTATVSDGEHTATQPFTVTVRDTCYFNKWGKWVCTWPAHALLCKN